MAEMLPPWMARPDLPYGSIGWRMGSGEDYWHDFNEWYARKGTSHREAYRRQYPEPESWAGFYEIKEDRLAG